MEIVVLNKNFYKMDNQSGANVTVFGEFAEDGFKSGISISEAPIHYSEHEKITVFPARYRVNASIQDVKNRGGKRVTGLFFSDFELISKVEFKDVSVTK